MKDDSRSVPPREREGETVRSLRDLPRELPPGRDLWPQIQARLVEESSAGRPRRAALAWGQPRLAAAVALLALGAALVLGVWLPRARHGGLTQGFGAGTDGRLTPVTDQGDVRQRQALLRSLNARLQSLPAPSRLKVLADLKVIEQSMQDIQTALGRDPGNALLHEMLLETYQDEQHLLATVQEAGLWTREAGTGKGAT